MKRVLATGLTLLLTGCPTTGGSDRPDVGMSDSGADGGGMVAQCESLAANFATLCAGDPGRVCGWNAYGQLCRTGNAALLVASMSCLDQTVCRTFSDPNDGAACLTTAHASGETPAVRAAIESGCTACGGTGCTTVQGTAEILPYLSDADAAMFAGCRGTACSLVEVIAACSTVPGFGLFSSCR